MTDTDERCLHKRAQVEDTWSDGVIEVCLDCRARRKRLVHMGNTSAKKPSRYPWISAGEQVKRALQAQGRVESVETMTLRQVVTRTGKVEYVTLVIDDPIKDTK